jgi:hypothetical protein
MVRQAHHPEPGRRVNSKDPNSKFDLTDFDRLWSTARRGDPPQAKKNNLSTNASW